MISMTGKIFRKLFGTRNDRLVKAFHRRVEQVNALEDQVTQLTDSELKAKTERFRQRITNGELISGLHAEALAVAREVMDRSVGIRNIFDPQQQFDPRQLPTDIQLLYDSVKQEIETIEPINERGGHEQVPGWQQVDIPVEIYQAVRQWQQQSRPPFRARPFDVQLIGGMVLSEGAIAEMKTGEGKTIVAPLACYLACLESLKCYVVTVNDFLVQRDRDWVFPFYYHLGLTVGAIHPTHLQPPAAKLDAYHCDVVYGTSSEFGFDYLRDNMQLSMDEQVQKRHDFCIVDEVDSILIDEARTPLIISGATHDDAPRYGLADSVATHLIRQQRQWDAANAKVQQCQIHIKGMEGDIRNIREKTNVPQMREQIKQLQEQLPALEAACDQHVQYYEIEMEKKASHLTHEGVAEAQKQAGIGSFYVGNNMDFPHLLENALRGHVVYQRDKDYVVRDGEVIIVDEFTGRLMIGRQWSDGLHQAVEAKEKVKIKQETQTMATVTIQNYFKLFKRLAGMTGTAITEANEFNEIYNLDVICITTNQSVIRDDRDDLIYLTVKDKWEAILEEIKSYHDLGQPVLVGTTSVERSEELSKKLTKKHAIKHEVLNAKVDEAEREANIVDDAGELAAVMIATNMAGRGTDIRLRPIDRGVLIRHWQLRNLLPRDANADMSNDQLVAATYRHIAATTFGLKSKELDAMGHDKIYLTLLQHWAGKHGAAVGWANPKWWKVHMLFTTPPWHDAEHVENLSKQQCLDILDRVPNFALHRLTIWDHVEQMGGLHIVGTERHESRRIDNQLRGRSGRQGDRGSSRFFISIEDDLMQMFAKGWLMKALPKLGMKEGDALEHSMVTKAVERAQHKVEERNFETRKNLLEYDEVMEHQRNAFYGIRQNALEGQDINNIIMDYIADAVEDASNVYLGYDYVATQVAEWCSATLDVSIDPSKIRLDNQEDLSRQVRAEARAEMRQTVEVTLGEYMSDDLEAEQWDLRSLSSWAMNRFRVDLKHNQLRKMNLQEITVLLTEAADIQIEKKDLSGLIRFLDPAYAQNDLAEWAEQKFSLQLGHEALMPQPSEKPNDTIERVSQHVLEKATEAYRRRELEYPIDFVLDMYSSTAQQDEQWAATQLAQWAKVRYEVDWQAQDLAMLELPQLRNKLIGAAEPWYVNGKLESLVDQALEKHEDAHALADWAQQRFNQPQKADQLDRLDRDARHHLLVNKGRAMLRSELTSLERFVLLQILDTAWKDHLYAMDQLQDSVSARSITDRERDPRVVYKREGSQQFEQMQKLVRDRVTELIFRARLTPQVEARSVYGNQQAEHAESASAMSVAASNTANSGTQEQRQDLESAQRAGNNDTRPMSRHQRRAAAAGKGDQSQSQSPQPKPGYKKRKKRGSR